MGPLEKFASTLNLSGLTEMPDIRFPDPHSHHYQSAFDDLKIRFCKSDLGLAPLYEKEMKIPNRHIADQFMA